MRQPQRKIDQPVVQVSMCAHGQCVRLTNIRVVFRSSSYFFMNSLS